MNWLFSLQSTCKLKTNKWSLRVFQGWNLTGGDNASLFAYVQVPWVQPQKKFSFDIFTLFKMSILTSFSSFNNAFRLHLTTSKWDQERVRIAIYPLWTSSGWQRVEVLWNVGGSGTASLFAYVWVPRVQPQKKNQFWRLYIV